MSDSKFSNDAINLDEIPTVQKSSIKSLMPSFYQTNLKLRSAITVVLLSILLLLKYELFFNLDQSYQDPLAPALIVVSVVGLFIIIFGYFSDRAMGYQVRELDITLYKGVFFKKIVTQPFLRLQHIELKRGPIERKIGLATIQVFSAGGSQHTFSLPGLSLEQATSLRQYILAHKDVALHE